MDWKPPKQKGFPHYENSPRPATGTGRQCAIVARLLTVAVMQIVDAAPRQSARQELEKYLRDELADLARQVAAEWEAVDA